MNNKKIISSIVFLFSFISLVQTAFAVERIYGNSIIEYLVIPEDVVIYYDKSKNSEILPKIPEFWEDVVGFSEMGKAGSSWFRLFLVDGAYFDKFYLHYGGQAYISDENVKRTSDKALNGFYEGEYLAAYYFEGKNRIVLFSVSEEGEGKTINAYGFDNIDGIGSYDGLDTSNIKVAFHQENYFEHCSNLLVREYLDKTFMADSDGNGVDEIWYTFPSSCNNPYDRFDVIMQEDEKNFHAIKTRLSAGPAYDKTLFTPIESNMQNESSNKIAESVLTWLVSDVMTDEMYAAKTKIELLGKWIIKSQMIDDEFTLPENEQIQLEFLANGALLYNNPQNKNFPQGQHTYEWFFYDGEERGVRIKIADTEYDFTFSDMSGSVFISELSSYFMMDKIK